MDTAPAQHYDFLRDFLSIAQKINHKNYALFTTKKADTEKVNENYRC